MNTTTVPIGAHGTIVRPWNGDTYTVLEHSGEGRIAGWIIRDRDDWYTVYAERPGRDLAGWSAPNLSAAHHVVSEAAHNTAPGAPALRRDTFQEAHTAIDTIWTLDYPTTSTGAREEARARVASSLREAVTHAEAEGIVVTLTKERAREILDLIDN